MFSPVFDDLGSDYCVSLSPHSAFSTQVRKRLLQLVIGSSIGCAGVMIIDVFSYPIEKHEIPMVRV